MKFTKIKTVGQGLAPAVKKLLSIMLAISMLFSITAGINLSAYAEFDEEYGFGVSGDYEYKILDDGTIEVTEYFGSDSIVSIPNTMDAKTVTSIGAFAFKQSESLTNVTIPNSVTSIGCGAFQFCKNLINITIPNSVTNIGDTAFWCCESLINVAIPDSITCIEFSTFQNCISLTKITIPNSVTSIGSWAFSHCYSLTSVAIPNSVTNIDFDAFEYCENLTSVTIGEGLINIDIDIFDECNSLENITVDSNNKNYSSENGVLYNKSKTELVLYPIGKTNTSFTIPNSVRSIAESAFFYCESLTSVMIPNSVTSIGKAAFYGCKSLTSVIIPNSVTSIGMYAFWRCENLTSITIHNKNCDIYCEKSYWDGLVAESTTIYGYKGSTAEKYANNWGNTFVALEGECSHTWNSGKVTKKATCKATGVKTYTCTVCGEAITETIAKTAHTYKATTTKATTKKNGSKVTKCSVCGAKKSSTTIYYPKTITLSKTSYVYNGKAQKPTVTVKDSKGKKIASSNYTVSYQSGRKNVGKYTVTIKFKGNYSGTVKKTFTIKPKATTLSSVTAGKKKFTVKWKKQTTGYQIQYSTSSKFTNSKTVTVSKNSTTSKTVSKLTAKKKYYVRIRTYKTVKVNGKSTKIYSAWSKSKSVTTKK